MNYQINKFSEIIPNLFHGPCPGNKEDFDKIKTFGFDIIYNLAEELKDIGELEAPVCGEVILGEIPDFDVPQDFLKFRDQVRHVCNLLKAGKKVFVHCLMGHGRTSMVLACICSVMDPQRNLLDILKEVKDKAHGPERVSQISFVKSFYERVNYERTNPKFHGKTNL